MKYARDMRPDGASTQSADVLVEALPWIKNVTGKTVVIKYGGSAMVDGALRAAVMSDILLLKIIGRTRSSCTAGAAPSPRRWSASACRWSSRTGSASLSPAAMEVVRMVLTGKVNQELVGA